MFLLGEVEQFKITQRMIKMKRIPSLHLAFSLPLFRRAENPVLNNTRKSGTVES